MVISALCLAMGLVLKRFTSVMIPIMGVGGLKIGLSGIFTMIPSILYGPLYGGLVSGLNDLVGTLLRPDQGAWLPQFTLVAIFAGACRGYLWRAVRNVDVKTLKYVIAAFFSCVAAFGTVSLTAVSLFPQSGLASFLNQLTTKSGTQLYFATYIPLFVGLIGLGILLLNFFIEKKHTFSSSYHFIKLAFVFLTAGIISTTINTFLIMDLYQIKKAFVLFYLPRVSEEIAVSVFLAYLLSLFLHRISKIAE